MTDKEIRRTFFRFLNEGKAEMFRDAYYPEIDDYILNKIIEIDPESNGDDVSEWGKFIMKLKPTQSDIQQAGEDVAILFKARGLGTEIPDLSSIQSFEDLHYIAVDIANSKGNMSADEIQNKEESLNCPIVFDDGGFRVLEMNSPECAEHYGKGTMWPWAGQSSEGTMFQELSQRMKIYVVKNETDGSLYSLLKMGNRVRITNTNDEPVDKTMFPQEMITTIMNLNESTFDFYRQEDDETMYEQIAEGIVNALHENFNKTEGEIGNNDIKNAMNRVYSSIDNEDELDTKVKGVITNKSKELLKDSTKTNGKIMVKPNLIPEILNKTADEIENMNEGIMDTVGNFVSNTRDKIFGSDDDKGFLTDKIVNSLINFAKKLYPTIQNQDLVNSTGGFKRTILQGLLLLNDESQIESIMRPVMTMLIRSIIDEYPMLSAKNPKRCAKLVMDCFGGKGGLFNCSTDFWNMIKERVGGNNNYIPESVKMNGTELNNFLYEALEKQMGKLINESELWYGADEDPVDDNLRPEDDENFPNDKESQMNYDFGSRETEKDFGEWRQHTAANNKSELRKHNQYFSDFENNAGRKLMDKWVDGRRDLEDLEDANYMFTKNEEKQAVTTKLTESELHDMITESVRTHLTEAFSDIYQWENFDNDRDSEDDEYIPDYVDCIDPATLSNVLETMGWSYYDSNEIKDKQGREYVAYACRPAANSKYGIKEVIDVVKKSAEMPNGIFYQKLAHRYAPEMSTYWIIVEIVPKENYGKQLSLNM